jgi:hypothetical protein
MSESAHWEITLVRSSDMGQIGSLAYSFSLTPVLNRPGSFSMTLPLDDEIAYKIAKHATGISCERNDLVKWSGSIVSVQRDPAANTLALTAVGWLDELNHRYVRANEESNLIFGNVIGGEIAQALFTAVNSQTDTDSNVRPTHLRFGDFFDTQVRIRSYKRSQNYGTAVQELSDIENGFDIRVDPQSRYASTYPPDAFIDHKEVLFGYGLEPFNLANVTQNDDGTSTANRITVEGANSVTSSADDSIAIDAQAGMREEWLSISDVSDITIVGAYANAELVFRRYGNVTYDLKPLPYGDIPRLYDDFDLGDKVYLAVDAGALQVDSQALRVFTATIEGDAQGNEIISSIGTAAQS